METARLRRPGLPRRARGRPDLLRRQAVLRLRPRQRHVVSHVGRRHRRAAARAADAGGGVPHAQAASADHVLRRADALRGACWPIRRARPRTARSACACASRPARRCRPRSARRSSAKFGVDVLDGVGSTEMLHQYVCNSPGAVKYGTSGKPVPGYEVRLVDEHGKDVADGEVGEMLVQGPERRARATGTSARRAAPPSRAAGRARATSTRAMPRATTPTRAAPTTCSRCRASGCRRSRWRAR